MTALGLWADQYQSGDADGADVVTQAKAGAKIVRGMGPTDSTLAQTQRLLVGMLTEYAKAVQIQERHGNAGPHMYRAYGLANYAHTVLSRGRGPLLKLGCDVGPAPLARPSETLASPYYGSPGLLPEASVSRRSARGVPISSRKCD